MSRSSPLRRRFRLTLEYDGSGFSGWQLQARGVTVQGVLEAALERLCGHPVRVIGAGRTDSGVHATGQVAHFDTTTPRSPETIVRALNTMTPRQLAVLSAEAVRSGFHARNKAIYRQYDYRILTRRPPPALELGRVWHLPHPLDVDAMRAAAAHLSGTHDFSAFRAATCQASSPIKTVSCVQVERVPSAPYGAEVRIRIGADAFLQRMVRSLVGGLVEVGRGRWSPGRFQSVLASRDRQMAPATAPACGLYLTLVRYGDEPWRLQDPVDEETVCGMDSGDNSGVDPGHH